MLSLQTEATKTRSVIVLNGASSAGKSTLGQAVQEASEVPLLRMSLDFFLFGDVLPPRVTRTPDWPLVRTRLFDGYYGCLASLARAGSDLVVDHIFEDQHGYDAFMAALLGVDLFLVGVHCPLEELERREQSRGDRRLGDARRDLETVHSFCAYDIEVDSTEPPELNAVKILTAQRVRRSAC